MTTTPFSESRADIGTLKHLDDIVRVFQDDFEICVQTHHEHEIQFWRRAFVRTVFAFIEGTTASMKRIAADSYHQPDARFSLAELALVAEEAYELNDKGEAVTLPAKIPVTKNIRFAFNVFARTYSINYQLKVDDNRWADLKAGLKVRDRLMHPKRVEDLVVSDEDLALVRSAAYWFLDNIKACVRLAIEMHSKEAGG